MSGFLRVFAAWFSLVIEWNFVTVKMLRYSIWYGAFDKMKRYIDKKHFHFLEKIPKFHVLFFIILDSGNSRWKFRKLTFVWEKWQHLVQSVVNVITYTYNKNTFNNNKILNKMPETKAFQDIWKHGESYSMVESNTEGPNYDVVPHDWCIHKSFGFCNYGQNSRFSHPNLSLLNFTNFLSFFFVFIYH